MKTNDLLEGIVNILRTTPVSDELYQVIAYRINKELLEPHISEIKSGYEELIFKVRREALGSKDH